jgi:HEAT repeat protein
LRKASAEALATMGWQPGRDDSGASYWAVKKDWNKCIETGAPSVAALITEIKDYSQGSVSKEASVVLGKIDDPRAVDRLILALKDEHTLVRQGAAGALGKIADPRSFEPLIQRLIGSDQDSRQAVNDALVKIGSPVVEALIAALNHYNFEAVEVLGQICMQADDATLRARIVESLTTALNSGARYAAAHALEKIGDPRAVEPLIAVLQNTKNLVPQRQAAAEALGQIGDMRAIEPLIGALKDRSSEVPCAAIAALEKMKNPSVIVPLIEVLGDDKWTVRKAAAETLARMYRSGHLDGFHNELILAKRDRMASEHSDQTEHESSGGPNDCHSDFNRHIDNNGIGISFPI